jgi:hypothetical protein
VQVIQSQWFPSSNRQKADLETAARVYADQSIPIAMVLLTITAVSDIFSITCSLIINTSRLNMSCMSGAQVPVLPYPRCLLRKLQKQGKCLLIGSRHSFTQLYSYIGFEEAWNQIAVMSPGWKAKWPCKLYQTIVYVFFNI